MSSEQGGAAGQGPVSDRMRALLSRAAEEQLHEQRQVSAVLGELRTLVEDVDERLATGEQVERLCADVRELSARVEARLDAADARADELAERITRATELVGQAAQDLVGAVVTGVAERLDDRLGATAADLTSSVAELVEGGERRLATHVDDAVLALAEVVLRRRRAAAGAPAPAAQPPPAQDPPAEQPAPEEPADEPSAAPGPEPEPAGPPQASVTVDVVAADERAEDARGPQVPGPGDGFVLVPADVEDADAEPAPVVAQERRTADRRAALRSDGSGRRRRPWWRRA